MLNMYAMKRKWTVEKIRAYLRERGCTLISEEYESHTPIEYIAACGHTHKTLFNNIKNGLCLRCPKCTGYKKHDISEVRELFESRGCKLLTTTYERAHGKLEYIAACGHKAETTYSDFYGRETGLCRSCAMKHCGKLRRLSLEEIQKRFSDAGCRLLSTEISFPRGYVDYIAQCGHKESIILGNFINGGRGRICKMCNDNPGMSKEESEVADYIRSIYKGEVIEHYREFGKEIDIYIPEFKLGIEYDGIRWHGELMHKDKFNLLHKTEEFQKMGIRLLHFFDLEWREKPEIVKSMIADRLGIHKKKYYARKLAVRCVEPAEKSRFLKENHIQGGDRAKYAIGLYDKDDGLVSIMTFGVRRITGGESKFELVRFCNRCHTTVVGGATRLFKHFSSEHPEIKEYTTYANRRFSVGGLYKVLGFDFVRNSTPCYFYFKSNKLYHRMAFQKHKLKTALEIYDPSLSEWDNMKANGFDRIFDCGNIVFTKSVAELPNH